MSKKSRGRPTLFSDALRERMLALYKEGLTDAEVAKEIGVSEQTITNWKGKYPDFFASLKRVKDIVDGLVEASLFQRAVGYTYKSQKIFCYRGKVIKVDYLEHCPPDVTAGIFWLKNRQPERWRDVSKIEMETSTVEAKGQKVSFRDFCLKASYPAPFPKQEEMREFGMGTDEPRLLLGCRGVGKTDYVTILGQAYDCYCDYMDGKNSESCLIVTKSSERNKAIVEEIRKALIANGVPLEKENSTCLRVKGLHGKDHSVDTITVRAKSVRGRHPKKIIMDDPVTEEDDGEAARKQAQKLYNELHKLTSNITIIGQPVHKQDLYGKIRTIVKCMEVPHGTIPELDHDLEAQRLAGVSEESIQASYFLKVISENQTPFENINMLDDWPMEGNAVAFIDPSFKGGDYTAITIAKAYFEGVAIVGFTYKKAWNHCLEDMVKRMIEYGVKKVAFETNSLGDMPILLMRQSLPAGSGIGVIGKDSIGEKHARIMNAGAFAHLIHMSRKSDTIYKNQVIEYEYGVKNDDAPDSLASLLEWIGLIRGKRVKK